MERRKRRRNRWWSKELMVDRPGKTPLPSLSPRKSGERNVFFVCVTQGGGRSLVSDVKRPCPGLRYVTPLGYFCWTKSTTELTRAARVSCNMKQQPHRGVE